jgi:hypothetical protein
MENAHAICVVRTGNTGESDSADIAGFFAFRAIRTREGNALVFRQALESFRLDILEMGEQVAAARIGRNEAEALGIVEPFHGAGLGSHNLNPFHFAWARRPDAHRPREIKAGNQTRLPNGKTERKTNDNDDLM